MSDEECEFGLKDSFHVDNGELEGLRNVECFTLGVEWQMFRQKLDTHKQFTMLTHAANVKRLVALAEKYSRFAEDHGVTDDGFWHEIVVGGDKEVDP